MLMCADVYSFVYPPMYSFTLICTHSYSFVLICVSITYPPHTHTMPPPIEFSTHQSTTTTKTPNTHPVASFIIHLFSKLYTQRQSLNTLLSKLPTHPVLRPYVFEQFVILQRCTRCSVTARRNRKISTWRRITGIPSRAAKTDVTGPTGYTSC